VLAAASVYQKSALETVFDPRDQQCETSLGGLEIHL
jgi:hypothetical protein